MSPGNWTWEWPLGASHVMSRFLLLTLKGSRSGDWALSLLSGGPFRGQLQHQN